ncbi:hypothetical protein [Streptomyces sp. NPDC056192]|uniref:hypothetical protein n=1 Tax=unclassified Streptomyces TaxID=2593676 RepID=UPI0035E242F0
MAATVWARFVRHRWLPKLTVVVLLAALVTGLVLVRFQRRDDHNADVLATACAGVLPERAVHGILPDDETWRLRTDLDLTGRSGHGPRTLMTCSVEWGEEGSLDVTVVPMLDAPLRGVRLSDLLSTSPYAEEPKWATAYETATTQVTAACPTGLPGYPRPVTRFRVHASLNTEDDREARLEPQLGEAVAAVANDVREKSHCGGTAVEPSDVRPLPRPVNDYHRDSDENPASCRWFRPGLLGDDGWARADRGNQGASHDWARACSLSLQRVDTPTRQDQVAAVSSASWWGAVLPEVRGEYGAELAALTDSPATKADQRSYPLAVWAESVCAKGRTLSRVTVDTATRALSVARIDGLVDAYLDSADCRDTRILGKVWK